MKPDTRRWVQIFLAAALLIAGARLLWIFLDRRAAGPAKAPAAGKLNPDFLVYPPRSYLSALHSAEAMKGATVWVRDGWRYTSQPFNQARRRSVPGKDAAVALGPLQKITVQDVITEPSGIPDVNRVDFVFEDSAARPPLRALAIGTCQDKGEDCRFYVDEMFFLKDPRQLYSHWKPDAWKAIANHEAREGMSEMQLNFSLGPGRVLRDRPIYERMVEFRPPGRPPLVVAFDQEGYARRIEQGQ